jgi:hypothetical protein
MPKKDGKPTKAELRILERAKRQGGVVVLTKSERGEEYTSQDGKRLASDDAIISRMIRDGLFKPAADDGLFKGISQTFIPAA